VIHTKVIHWELATCKSCLLSHVMMSSLVENGARHSSEMVMVDFCRKKCVPSGFCNN